MIRRQRETSKKSVLVSIVIHTIAILALATITFRYPLAAFLHPEIERVKPETIRYIALPHGPAAPVGNGANPDARPPKGAPAPLRAPTMTPVGIPPVTAPPSAGAASGKEGGQGGAPTGMATGVEPRMPDERIALEPGKLAPMPLTKAQAIDTLVKGLFRAYNDSMAIAERNRGRDPGDWTVKKGDQTWGIDKEKIHLGKFSIPTAVLALLPMKAGSGVSPVDARATNWMRQDVMEHAQRAITEDEFRAAVKRVRDRKQKEHDGLEAQIAVRNSSAGSDAVVPMPEHGAKP